MILCPLFGGSPFLNMVKQGAYMVKQGAYMVKQGAYMVKQGAYTVKQGAYMVKQGAYMVKQGAYMVKQGDYGHLFEVSGWPILHLTIVRRMFTPRKRSVVTGIVILTWYHTTEHSRGSEVGIVTF